MNNPMTPTELQAEYDYRVTERIGIMCGTDDPTPGQRAEAEREAGEIGKAVERKRGLVVVYTVNLTQNFIQ